MHTPSHTKQETADRTRKQSIQNTRVAVVGLGRTGLSLALRAVRHGHPVVGFDMDTETVQALSLRHFPHPLNPIEASFLESPSLTVTTNPSGIEDADVYTICMTPTETEETHGGNVIPLIQALRTVVPKLKADALLLIETPVHPRVCEELILPILRDEDALSCKFAYAPARVIPKHPAWDTRPTSHLMCVLDQESARAARAFYASLKDEPTHFIAHEDALMASERDMIA